jgi:hypothetical protein
VEGYWSFIAPPRRRLSVDIAGKHALPLPLNTTKPNNFPMLLFYNGILFFHNRRRSRENIGYHCMFDLLRDTGSRGVWGGDLQA